MNKLLKRSDIMLTDNEKSLQDYLVKMAPDFSVFQLAEKYYYDNNLTGEYFNNVFSYKPIPGTQYTSNFFRGMFQVYTEGTVSVQGLEADEYVVIDYRGGLKVVISAKESQIVISSTDEIELVIGVAF
jgi:hypothetical protein